MGLFTRQKKQSVALFDISSASIGSALIEEGGAVPRILWKNRKEIPFDQDLNYKRFISATLATIRDASQEMLQSQKVSPREIHVVLDSPWFIGQTRHTTFEKNEDFTVHKDLISKIADKEKLQFEETFSANAGRGKHEIIETAQMRVKLNGYETTAPVGKRARSLALSFYASMGSTEALDAFRRVLTGAFHQNKIIFHTLPLVFFTVLRELRVDTSHAILCDVGGEVTELIIIRDGMIAELISFPLGKNFLLRWVAEKMQTDPGEVPSLISLWSEGKLESKRQKAFEEILTYVGREWSTELVRALEQAALEPAVSTRVFLLGAWATIPVFTKFLLEAPVAQVTMTNKPFAVIPISDTILESAYVANPGAEGDAFLTTEAVFLHKISSWTKT